MQIKQIAYIRSDFVEKFGIPRQSNLADTRAEIHFLPEYQNADALREIEAYDYLWLIWEFSESIRDTWSPTVRPPRLGGNRRVGVFATRSPISPESDRTFFRKAYWGGIPGKRRPGADRGRCGSSGYDADLRYQALPSIRG